MVTEMPYLPVIYTPGFYWDILHSVFCPAFEKLKICGP